jgi:signal transduction histidine kinase
MIKIIVYLSALLAAVLVGCTSKTTDKNNNANNDSIQKYIALASNDTLDHAIRIQYNDKALSFLDVKKNDSLTKEYLNSLVFNYLGTKEWKKYHRFAKIYFQKSNEAQDTLGLARCYRYKASFYRNTDFLDSSFYYYCKAEKFYKKTNDKMGLETVYFFKSSVQFKLDDYLGSELSSKKGLLLSKKSKDYYKIYAFLISIGNCYHNLKQYDKAIATIKEALQLVEKYKVPSYPDYSPKITCLNNIGNAYREMKEYTTAISYFKLALQEKKLIKKDIETRAYLLSNLGYCYLKTKNYTQIPFLFYKSDSIFKFLGIKNEQSLSNVYLSQYYFIKKDTIKAINYSEKALQLAKEAKAPYYYLLALNNAGSINSKKAPQYIQEYHQKNENQIFEERNARNQYYKIQFETDEISQEKETAIQQKWIITGVALAVLVILFLLFIIFLQRSRQKELQFLRSQEKANEEIYQLMLAQKSKEEAAKQAEKKRISLELHDGIMNKLASTRLNLAVLSHNREDATITKCLTHITDIYQIEQEIRTIAHDLNKEVFQKSNSYTELLQDFVSDQNKNATTHYELEVEEAIDWTAISSELKMNLYRIIQEACHNINKHAAAKKAIISIILDLPNICLSICDDGIGFDTSKKADGIGIQNIQQRVKLLNGKFSMYSTPHTATSINVAIPI